MKSRAYLEHAIASRLRACSLDELRVMDRVLEGIEIGRDAYGPLDLARDVRMWKREAAMELRDWMFYMAAHDVAADHFDREQCADDFRRAVIDELRSNAERARLCSAPTAELVLCLCGHPQALHAHEHAACLVGCECALFRSDGGSAQ